MRNDYTHISMVLDRSGSMASIKNDIIGGFNEFIKSQRAIPGACSLTLVQFDAQGIDTLHDAAPLDAVPELNERTYQPRGGTPLYDAVGQTILATGNFLKDKPDHERPAKVAFVILTDGLENSSREFNRQKVFEMIQHQREIYKWEFVFIGANQDAMQAGEGMGIARANVMNLAANADGVRAMYRSTSSNLARYRQSAAGSGHAHMGYSEAQRSEQDAAGLDPKYQEKSAEKK